jgi:hypothetical protein
MKHNKKVNPLKHFNDLKAAAVKKAGKDMSTYKKSLKKAQTGIAAGPKTEKETMMESVFNNPNMNDPMAFNRGPRATSLRQDINQEMRDMTTNKRSNAMNQMLQNAEKSERMKALTPSYQIDPATARMIDMGRSKNGGAINQYKKGGSVKRKRR